MRHIELGQIITPAKPRRAGEINFPVLSMTMRDGLVNQADKFKKRIASADTSQYKVVGRNQLVVGFPIDEGVLAFQNLYDEAIVSPAYNIWNLQNDALIDSKYLEQFLRSPRALAFYKSKLRSTTARRRSLPNDVFLSLSVPVPSLAEQERIMKLLDEADTLRKLRAQADRSAAALIPALFHEMFGDPLKSSAEWEVEEIRTVCIIGDGNHSSNYPKASEMLPAGIPFIRAANLQYGKLDIADMRYISPDKHMKLKKGHLKSGDVLFSNRGEIGKLAIVPDEFDNSNLNSQLAWLRPKKEILPEYLFSLLASDVYQTGFRRSQQGAALQQFTIKQLSAIKVPIPPLSLQQEFAQRVSEIRELEAAQAASRQRVEHLFQSMLHRAFNQEL